MLKNTDAKLYRATNTNPKRYQCQKEKPLPRTAGTLPREKLPTSTSKGGVPDKDDRIPTTGDTTNADTKRWCLSSNYCAVC